MSAKVSADILKEAFQKYDTDNSGTIDASELRLLFKDLGWSVDDGAFRQALRLLDSDNSGTIEWGEFRKWSDFAWSYKILKTKNSTAEELTVMHRLESLEEAPESEDMHEAEASKQTEILRAAFDRYDTDKSGSIESNELSKIFTDLRWPFTEESIQQAMDCLDSDHSGTIDWEEFANWSKQKLDTSTIMEEEEVSSKSDVQVTQPALARKPTEKDVQGTHEGYLQEVAELERQRQRRLEESELLARYREESVNRWFGEEQREADEAMQRELESIKGEMMDQLREHKRRLEEERNNNDLMEERPLSGWRKSNRKTPGGSKGHGGSKRRKQERVTGPKIVYSLKEGDINEDVQNLAARPSKEKSKQQKDSRRGPA